MPKGRDGGGEWKGREAARVETRAAEDRAVEVFASLSHRQLVETNPSTEVALGFVRGRCEVRWARLTAGEKAYFHGLVEDQQQDEQEERMAGLERQEVKSHEKGKKGRGKSFLDQDTSSGDEEEQVTKESDQGKEDTEDSEDEGSRREEEGSSEEEESRGSRREELEERRVSRPGNRKLTGFHVFCAREREQVGREKPRLVQGRGKGRWGLGRELARR